MYNKTLDNLVRNDVIKNYQYSILNNYGYEVLIQDDNGRNTERLVIEFVGGEKLIIDTFCSGSAEDTTLHFKVENE